MTTRIMGRYEVVGLLGSGGIGQVYAAQDQALGRSVAIKALRPEYSGDKFFLERFYAEAASLARLSHQNVATLYDLQSDGQQVYMILELVRGHTLEAALARTRRLSVDEALAVAAQTVAGLGYAHRMGVIHRDVKPSNLMLTDGGIVKIMDFGIARVRGSQRLTRAGSIVGTLAYVAPEQIKGGEGDERSDLYSLACVLYEMLAGDPPFNAETEYELIRLQVDASPPALEGRVPGLAAALQTALMRGLAKDPRERFASVEEFARALGADALATRSAELLRAGLLATLGPTAAPTPSAEPIAIATPSAGGRDKPASSKPRAAPALDEAASGKKAPPGGGLPAYAPVAVLGLAAFALLAGVGYILLNSGSPPAPPSPVPAAAGDQTAAASPDQGRQPSTLPKSSLLLPSPEAQERGEPVAPPPTRLPEDSRTQALAEAPRDEAPPHANESPAYEGRVADWPGPNLIVVPMTGSFGLKFLKLYGVLDASSGQVEAEEDHLKLKGFLAQAGNQVVCYARGDETFQCYANKQDIALWAVRNGLAKPAPDAPKEYREARD